MPSILTPRPTDRPPQREDWGTGVTISVVAHVALIGALIWGVHWHSKEEVEGTSAELWSAVPQAAAPAPTAPPPPPDTAAETPPPPPPPAPQPPAPAPPPPPVAETPKPPDIVTERLVEKQKRDQQLKALKDKQEQQAKLDKAKADQQKADKAKADAAKQQQQQQQQTAQQQKLDAQKLAKLHDENLKRMMGQMDAPADATGTAARNAGPSASYGGRIKARIRPNIVFTDAITGNPSTEVEVRCAPDGTIIGRRITQASGVKEWDDAVLRAIDRTAVLPRDVDGRVPSPMLITFKPGDVGN